jgi:hypothetical protein
MRWSHLQFSVEAVRSRKFVKKKGRDIESYGEDGPPLRREYALACHEGLKGGPSVYRPSSTPQSFVHYQEVNPVMGRSAIG